MIKIASLLLAIVWMSSVPIRLAACSCEGIVTVEDAIRNADAVLVAKVLDREIIVERVPVLQDNPVYDTRGRDIATYEMPVARYRLLVQHVYKGEITSDTVIVYTATNEGACGVEFITGRQYIVYANHDTKPRSVNADPASLKNTYRTHLCSRTIYYHQEEITAIEKILKKKKHRKANK